MTHLALVPRDDGGDHLLGVRAGDLLFLAVGGHTLDTERNTGSVETEENLTDLLVLVPGPLAHVPHVLRGALQLQALPLLHRHRVGHHVDRDSPADPQEEGPGEKKSDHCVGGVF